jgi:hypothetical protein
MLQQASKPTAGTVGRTNVHRLPYVRWSALHTGIIVPVSSWGDIPTLHAKSVTNLTLISVYDVSSDIITKAQPFRGVRDSINVKGTLLQTHWSLLASKSRYYSCSHALRAVRTARVIWKQKLQYIKSTRQLIKKSMRVLAIVIQHPSSGVCTSGGYHGPPASGGGDTDRH